MANTTKPKEFINLLATDMHCALPQPRTEGRYAEYKLDLQPLRLNFSRFTPLLTCDDLRPAVASPVEVDLWKRDLRSYNARNNVPFSIGVTHQVVPPELTAMGAIPEDFVILDGQFAARFAADKDFIGRMRLLGMEMVRQVGVLRLSPYATDVPASGGRFFGRQQLLREISSGLKSFTFIGPRRIGKTSVLNEIQERLKAKYADSDVLRVSDIMATRFTSTWEVLAEIIHGFNKSGLAREAYKLEKRPLRINHFPAVIKSLTGNGRKRLVAFIDEVDHIIEFDENQNYECLHILRAAFTQENCQIFLAGFKHASRARDDDRSPLFGFTEFREILPLGIPDTREMIVRPFQNLGINIPQIAVQSIAHESAGHPQIVTLFCHEILTFFDRNNRLPEIEEMTRDIFAGEELHRKVVSTFLVNSTNVFEEFVSLLLMREALRCADGVAQFEFHVDTVNKLIESKGVDLTVRAIQTICNNLRLRSIIAKVEGVHDTFRFSIPQLVKFCAGLRLDLMIEKLSKAVRNANWGEMYSEQERAAADRLFGNSREAGL